MSIMKTLNIHVTLAFSVMCLLMAAACTEKQAEEEAPVIDIDISKAVPLKEAVSSVDVIMLQDSSAAHFPGDLTKVVWEGS